MAIKETAIKTVVLTRPQGSNAALASKLNKCGLQCIELPMLKIAKLTETNEIDCALRQLKSLSQQHCDYALFVSANAVNSASEFVRQHAIIWPRALACLGMGSTTEATIAANGWQLLSVVDSVSGDSLTSEQMLAQPWAQDVAGRRIAIIKGRGGRSTMADVLAERGAQVESIALYSRQPVHYGEQQLQASLQAVIQQPQSSAIVAASGETLEYTAAALARLHRPELTASVRCIVPSQRLLAQAQELGFVFAGLADGAGDNAFFDYIASHLSA